MNTKLKQLTNELNRLQERVRDVSALIDIERSKKQLKCACGKMHAIKSCDAIQTHWYTSPSGCSGGDYWNAGELWVRCPDNAHIANRLLYSSCYVVPYDKRDQYAHNAEKQFVRLYKSLFKSVTDTYGDSLGLTTYNNYHVDNHHKKFDIDIGFPFTPK